MIKLKCIKNLEVIIFMGVFKKIKSKILVGILSGVAMVCVLSSEARAMDHPEAGAGGFDIGQLYSILESSLNALGQNRLDNLMGVALDCGRAVEEAASVTEEFLDGLHGVRTVELRTQDGNITSATFDFDNLTISLGSQVPVSVTNQDGTAAVLNHPFFATSFFADNPQWAEYLAFARRTPTDRPTVLTTVWNLNDGSYTVTVDDPPLGSCDFPIPIAIRDNVKRVLYVLCRSYEVIARHVI